MDKKRICKILCALAVAFFLSFGTSTTLVFGDHFCTDCVETYIICPCPAKRTQQLSAEAPEIIVTSFVCTTPPNNATCPFLWGPCPVELKTRMNN